MIIRDYYFLTTGQFYEMVGTNIPYDQLGFPTLVELLKSVPGLRKVGLNHEGDVVLSLDASQSGGMSHIQDMVKRQQNKQVKRSAAKYVVSKPGMVGRDSLRYLILRKLS